MAGVDGDLDDLRRALERLDGDGYGAYKRLEDRIWAVPVPGAPPARLWIERVQPDPYAPPSRVSVSLPPPSAGVPAQLLATGERRRALADHLARRLRDRARPGLRVDAGGQEVLARSACRAEPDGTVVARVGVELPARGRRIRGEAAARLVATALPQAALASLRWAALDRAQAVAAVQHTEDAVALRGQLAARGLVAFVADGAVLPRRSGVDDRPLSAPGVVPFAAPGSLRVTLEAPNAGPLVGMGVPEGVTLIVGGGFHGKSTLLRALERGVYDHVAGDGRERVVSVPSAVKVRAEDGRRIARVDVHAFVGTLPSGADTGDFSTDDASGSTSQAAGIAEAVEAGAATLLLDEDTSATNLMVRDQRMQALVAKEREPLTPFCDLVGSLHRDHGVSTVMVAGGSGDYFDVADTVIWMDGYRAREVTAEARAVAARLPGRRPETTAFPPVAHRVVDAASVDPRRRGRVKTRAHGTAGLRFGGSDVDLGAVEQIVDPSQTVGIARALVRLVDDHLLGDGTTVAEALDALEERLGDGGVEWLRGGYPGDVALPRRFEIAAALNRLRSLRVLGHR